VLIGSVLSRLMSDVKWKKIIDSIIAHTHMVRQQKFCVSNITSNSTLNDHHIDIKTNYIGGVSSSKA
jgi:hypothetical protein